MRDRRRFAWLDRIESGQSTSSLARDYGVSQRTIQLAVADARAEVLAFVEAQRLLWPPQLVLFFPINGLFPGTLCRHDVVPVPLGTTLCCAVCHQSGKDDHPALQRYPRFDPQPDPPTTRKHAHQTRRQRRAPLSDHATAARRVQAA